MSSIFARKVKEIKDAQREKIRLDVIKRLGNVCAKGCGEPVTSSDEIIMEKGKLWHARCDPKNNTATDISDLTAKDAQMVGIK